MLWALGKKKFMFYIFFDLGVIEKNGRKYLGGHWIGPKKLLLKQ
jgi:hypothetical protein